MRGRNLLMDKKYKKIPDSLLDYVMNKDDLVVFAMQRIAVARIYRIILVVDDDETLYGVISWGDREIFNRNRDIEDEKLRCSDFCNRKFSYLHTTQDKYLYGRSLFAENSFCEIPILDDDGVPQEIFGRFQAFFLDYYNRGLLPRQHYATLVMNACDDARHLGYKRISVIEFGVASGNGLYALEIIAGECGRLYGIDIDVYGFDSGEGLYEPKDYRDMNNIFGVGWYKGNLSLLKKRLRRAKLVIGDICETVRTFLSSSIAPIGAMIIDVDQYTPATSILRMLEEDHSAFLPQVYLYFDDLLLMDKPGITRRLKICEFQGEWLAICEFNQRNSDIKISPVQLFNNLPGAEEKIKICYRFTHPQFDKIISTPYRHIPLYN